jgi:hypothetical protein
MFECFNYLMGNDFDVLDSKLDKWSKDLEGKK